MNPRHAAKSYFYRTSEIETLLKRSPDKEKKWLIDSIIWGLKNMEGKDDPAMSRVVEREERILRLSPAEPVKE